MIWQQPEPDIPLELSVGKYVIRLAGREAKLLTFLYHQSPTALLLRSLLLCDSTVKLTWRGWVYLLVHFFGIGLRRYCLLSISWGLWSLVDSLKMYPYLELLTVDSTHSGYSFRTVWGYKAQMHRTDANSIEFSSVWSFITECRMEFGGSR